MAVVTMARPQLNLRLDARTDAMLTVLCDHFNLGKAAVIRLALAELMRARGLPLPTALPEREGADDGD